MDKESQLYGSDLLDYYLRRMGKGALVGAGTASIINLIHNVRSNMADKKERERELDPDEGTIVLTLPRKNASCDKVVATEGPTTKVYPATVNNRQRRDEIGRFGESIAKKAEGDTRSILESIIPKLKELGSKYLKPSQTNEKNWWDRFNTGSPESTQLATGVLLSLAAAGGGYGLADWRYNKYRKGVLKAEEEKAKKEYLDQLTGDFHKYSGYIDRTMCIPELRNLIPVTKQAQAKDPHYGSVVGAYGLLLLSALTGGSAYLTKQILDANRRSMDTDPSYKPPKTTRIVLRSLPASNKHHALSDGSDEEDSKLKLAEDEMNQIKAAFLIIKDVVGNENKLEKNSELKALFDKYDTSVEKIAKVLDRKDVGLLDKEVADVLPKDLAEKIAQETNIYDTFSPQLRAALLRNIRAGMGLQDMRQYMPQSPEDFINKIRGLGGSQDQQEEAKRAARAEFQKLLANNPDAAYDIIREMGPSAEQLTSGGNANPENLLNTMLGNMYDQNLDINKHVNKFKYGPDYDNIQKMYYSPIPTGIRSGELNPDDFHRRFRPYSRSGGPPKGRAPTTPIADYMKQNPNEATDIKSLMYDEIGSNRALQDTLRAAYKGPGADLLKNMPDTFSRSLVKYKAQRAIDPVRYRGASVFPGARHPDLMPQPNPEGGSPLPSKVQQLEAGGMDTSRTSLGQENRVMNPPPPPAKPPIAATGQPVDIPEPKVAALRTIKDIAMLGILGDSIGDKLSPKVVTPDPRQVEEQAEKETDKIVITPKGEAAEAYLTPIRARIIRKAIKNMLAEDLSRQRVV